MFVSTDNLKLLIRQKPESILKLKAEKSTLYKLSLVSRANFFTCFAIAGFKVDSFDRRSFLTNFSEINTMAMMAASIDTAHTDILFHFAVPFIRFFSYMK